MSGAYLDHPMHEVEEEPPIQTELKMGAKIDSPYDGLFFCFIRQGLFRWPEFISFYKRKRL